METACVLRVASAGWLGFWLVTFLCGLGGVFSVRWLEFQWEQVVLRCLLAFSFTLMGASFWTVWSEVWRHGGLAGSFGLCYRCMGDLIVFNGRGFLGCLRGVCPSQLAIGKAGRSCRLADYLDLTFVMGGGGGLSAGLCGRRDDFGFRIVGFPCLSSGIPPGPSCGVYISQLIRYARCCSRYDDFRYHHKCLVDRLLSRGYIALRLEKSFKKFYGRYQDLIEKYQRSVNVMVNDSFPGWFLFDMKQEFGPCFVVCMGLLLGFVTWICRLGLS